jgi:hypothetical protein
VFVLTGCSNEDANNVVSEINNQVNQEEFNKLKDEVQSLNQEKDLNNTGITKTTEVTKSVNNVKNSNGASVAKKTGSSQQVGVNNNCEKDGKVYFDIPELGIAILVDESVKDDLVYGGYEGDQYGAVSFSAKSLIDMNDSPSCSADAGPLLGISRINGNAHNDSDLMEWSEQDIDELKQFDDSYIRIHYPNGDPIACSLDFNDIELYNHTLELRKKIRVDTVEDVQCIKKI